MRKLTPALLFAIAAFALPSDSTENTESNKSSPGKAILRILTHNVYGLTGNDCEMRAKTFGLMVAKAAPKYDIVGVQEYYDSPGDYDCDPKHLSNAIWSTGRYKNRNNYYRFYPEVTWNPDGGVGIFSYHPIQKFDHWRWKNDKQPVWKGAEGFVFARIILPGTGVSVDTYIVHLNSGPDIRSNRKIQLEQLADRIKSNSGNSGYPVLVMGDFNIGGPPGTGGNEGYEDIMEVLKNPTDIWLTAHPDSGGYTNDCIKNPLAAAQDGKECQERIDYIFFITDRSLSNSRYGVKVANNPSVKVVRWLLPKTVDHRAGANRNARDHRSRYISDHFGLEATIQIYEKPPVRDHRNRN